MIKFKTNLRVGNRTIEIEETVENANEMFERLAHWDSWIIKAPEGANDVFFRFRKTKEKGFKYYSLVCPSKDKEFHFGQSNDGKNTLFPKHKEGWVDRYHVTAGEDEQEEVQQPRYAAQAATAAQSPKQSEPRPLQANAAQQQAEATAKTEQQVLLNDLSRIVSGTLIYPHTKEFAGDFFFALTGVPKQQASVHALKLAIAACSSAVKQQEMLRWASMAWRAETSTLFSLTSKMNCLGWMVRFLGDGGDFKDLQQKINGDPTTKDYKSFLVMRDNLKSWFTPEEGELTDKDIGF